MFQTLLIGLDGSIYSERALELGIRWARHNRAVLVGLGVIDEPTIRTSGSTATSGSYRKLKREEDRLKDAHRRVAWFLERFTKRCTEAGVTCQALEKVGLPSERILVEANAFELIFLGQRTYFHFETQTDPDETLRVVLRKGSRPVVAVGEKLPESRSVLVAYDGSPPAIRALEAFQRAGLDQWEAVQVVSVARDRAKAARQAEEAVRLLRSYNLPAEARSLVSSRPVAELLLQQIRDLKPGLLVMGAFGRSQFAQSLFGSTTQAVLEKADTLLFLHH
jgi:nucleotide-binding universal stress UspA family protein